MFQRAVVANTSTDGMEAGEILLSFRSLIESEPRNVSAVRWASKRRRSAGYSEPSPPLLLFPPPAPKRPKLQAKPSSPVTTPAIWRRESDDKAKDSTKRKPKRMKREALRSRVDELRKENQSFAEEPEKKSNDYEHLGALNLALKAKIIGLTFGTRLPRLEIPEEERSNSTSIIHLDKTKTSLGIKSCTTEVIQTKLTWIPDLNLCPDEVHMDLVY